MQKNKIEMMNLTGARLLVYLDVSHNQLMNIHGLVGCSNLRHLDLSHNKITRVGKNGCGCWLSLCIMSKCIYVRLAVAGGCPVYYVYVTVPGIQKARPGMTHSYITCIPHPNSPVLTMQRSAAHAAAQCNLAQCAHS